MRIALLTDLHANREATEAVLDSVAEQRVDRHALIGDFVGYGADPSWVVDAARRLVADGALAVMGNHDQAIVSGAKSTLRAEVRTAIEWTRKHLDRSQIDFLAALPLTRIEGDCLFVHANAWDPLRWDYVESRTEAMRSLRATPARYTFCGHMHEPMLYHLSGTGKGGEFKPVPGISIPVPPHRQWLAIAGSVGQPRDNNPAACYAVFDSDAAELTFHRVPYDSESASAKVRAAGLPQHFADRLIDGN